MKELEMIRSNMLLAVTGKDCIIPQAEIVIVTSEVRSLVDDGAIGKGRELCADFRFCANPSQLFQMADELRRIGNNLVLLMELAKGGFEMNTKVTEKSEDGTDGTDGTKEMNDGKEGGKE